MKTENAGILAVGEVKCPIVISRKGRRTKSEYLDNSPETPECPNLKLRLVIAFGSLRAMEY